MHLLYSLCRLFSADTGWRIALGFLLRLSLLVFFGVAEVLEQGVNGFRAAADKKARDEKLDYGGNVYS